MSVASSAALCLVFPATGQAPPSNQVFRIGFLRPGRPPVEFVRAFEASLQELGYIVGRNLIIEYRTDEVSSDALAESVNELVKLKVHLIVVSGTPPALAAKKVTQTMPIVFVGVTGPKELGLVTNLGNPGANVTGMSMNAENLVGKRMQLMKEVVPDLRRVQLLWHTDNPANLAQLGDAGLAGQQLNIRVHAVPIGAPLEFESAFAAAQPGDAFILLDNPFFITHRARLGQLAIHHRVPALAGFKEFVSEGVLMSYGADLPDLYRRAAIYVDKILRGASPGQLPVQQPTKFEWVISTVVARHLGLRISVGVLQRADRVIE